LYDRSLQQNLPTHSSTRHSFAVPLDHGEWPSSAIYCFSLGVSQVQSIPQHWRLFFSSRSFRKLQDPSTVEKNNNHSSRPRGPASSYCHLSIHSNYPVDCTSSILYQGSLSYSKKAPRSSHSCHTHGFPKYFHVNSSSLLQTPKYFERIPEIASRMPTELPCTTPTTWGTRSREARVGVVAAKRLPTSFWSGLC
jgi:hypothetical protein